MNELFHLAVKEWLFAKGLEVASVTSVKQEEESGGYCETCAWYEEFWAIKYLNAAGETFTYRHYDYMGDFVTELSEAL